MTERPLVFGRVPAENLFALSRRAQPLMDLLGERLGNTFKTRILATYERVIAAMVDEEFDFVTIGSAGLLEAQARGARYRPLVAPVRDGRSGYRALIVARVDEGIDAPQDLRGKRVAFVSRRSTAGYVAAASCLNDHGVNLFDYEYSFVGSYDNVLNELLAGNVDAGAIFEDARDTAKQTDAHERTKVIARSGMIPNEPIAVSPTLAREQPELVDRLVKMLLVLHEDPAALAAVRQLWPAFDRFQTVDDEAVFESVRDFTVSE